MKQVSKETYKKCILILTVVFVVMFVTEFISVLTGNPITEIHISGLDLEKDVMSIKLLRAFLSACFIGGIFNLFLAVKVIKESRGKDRLPTVVVIIMTLMFPVEVFISGIFVVPDIIFWGIMAFTKTKKASTESYDDILSEKDAISEDGI